VSRAAHGATGVQAGARRFHRQAVLGVAVHRSALLAHGALAALAGAVTDPAMGIGAIRAEAEKPAGRGTCAVGTIAISADVGNG